MPSLFAFIISFALHAVLVLVIIWQGKDFIKTPPKLPAIEITATSYDPVKQAQAKQRQEEQKKQQQKQQAERNRQLEQQRKKQAEEQRRQEQAKQEQAKQEAAKKAAEQKKQQELANKKQAEQKQQQERQQQEAQRQAELAKQQAEQEAARQEFVQQRQAEKAAQAEKDANAINDMKAVIFNLIANEWIRPLDILENLETTLEVQLLATGELLAVKIIKSSGNPAYDESTLNAFYAALPFPLMQLEPRQRDAFRKFTLTFAPEDLLSD